MLFSQDRQAALGHEIEAFLRSCRCNRFHILLKAYSEIRIMPGDQRLLEFSQKKPQIFLHCFKIQRLVRNYRINTEGTGVRATHTSNHGNEFEEGGFLQRWLDELPAFLYARQVQRLLTCR